MPVRYKIDYVNRFAGILLGTAVGDAIGLPMEGISPRRIKRLRKGELGHHLFFRRGMISDDTEHALMVAQALVQHNDDADAFARSLGWKFRFWFLAFPAGLGMATLRSCIKLWLGFSPKRSGVFSAGNGPAMRSAIIGAYFHDDRALMEKMVRVSTMISHTDPKAQVGALAVALAAAWATEHGEAGDRMEAAALLTAIPGADENWLSLAGKIQKALSDNVSVSEFARDLGLAKGVTGYMYHTVPVALYAWLCHYGDFPATLQAVVECGGDTDTVGAIACAVAGATVGKDGIPKKWIEGIVDWPRSKSVLHAVSEQLARRKIGEPATPVRYFRPAVPVRNLVFFVIVLLHGFRRLLPPY